MDLLGWLLSSSDLVLPWSSSYHSLVCHAPVSGPLHLLLLLACSAQDHLTPSFFFFHCVHITMLTPVRRLSCLTKSSALSCLQIFSFLYYCLLPRNVSVLPCWLVFSSCLWWEIRVTSQQTTPALFVS